MKRISDGELPEDYQFDIPKVGVVLGQDGLRGDQSKSHKDVLGHWLNENRSKEEREWMGNFIRITWNIWNKLSPLKGYFN